MCPGRQYNAGAMRWALVLAAVLFACPAKQDKTTGGQPMTSTKRPFKRDRGMVHDEYTDANGRKVGFSLPSSMLDEQMSEEVRRERLEEVASGIPGTYPSSGALHDDSSPELLDALLKGLAAGDM